MYYLPKSVVTEQAFECQDNLDMELLDECDEPCYTFGSMEQFRLWRCNIQHIFTPIEM